MRNKKIIITLLVAILVCIISTNAFAANDPVTAINDVSNVVIMIIIYTGIIFFFFGVLKMILSIKNRDSEQRASGFLNAVEGSIVVLFMWIINLVVG